MTKNQIEFQKLQELKRSNRAQEQITLARDTAARELGAATLSETTRHNMAYESETKRHNQAVEQNALIDLGIKRDQTKIAGYDAETRRLAHGENVRSNMARETETNRHNVAQEAETVRSNKAREAETHRSNLANEAIGWTNAQTNQFLASEQRRANMAREEETHRSNVRRESQTQYSLEQKDREIYNQGLKVGSDIAVNAQRVDMMKSQTNLTDKQAWNTIMDSALKGSNIQLNKQQVDLRGQQSARDWLNVGANYIKAIGSVLPG